MLKVRIIADMEERIRNEIEAEGISREEALSVLKKDDEQREKWSRYLYGINSGDASLYDLVIHIHQLTVENAVDIICSTASMDCFKTTPESQREIDNLGLAAEVKAAVIDLKPDIDVWASDGIVFIMTRAREIEEESLIKDIKEISKDIPGLKDVKVQVRLTDIVE